MKTTTGGNGVKVAKLVQEVNAIISDVKLSYLQKCKLLSEIETDKRPGKQVADDLIFFFTKKKREYKKLKDRIKDVRTYEKWEARVRSRINRENKTTLSIDEIVKLFTTQEEYKSFINGWDNFNFSVIKDKIKGIIFFCREKAKEINERENRIKDFEKETGLNRSLFGKERSIFEVQENKASNAYRSSKMYARFGEYYITVTQDVSEDWEAYSKSWHSAHGPKRTVESRDVNFYKDGKFESSASVNSFAGNYLINAIVSKFNLQKIKVQKELKKVQLIDQAEVILVRNILSTKIYKRILAGADLDFCAVHGGETFHAATISKAIAGLQKKLKAEKYFEREMISKEDGFKLGFCETGMKSFCEDNNLNYEGEYSRKDLRNIAVSNRNINCQKYAYELRKLGIVLNCK